MDGSIRMGYTCRMRDLAILAMGVSVFATLGLYAPAVAANIAIHGIYPSEYLGAIVLIHGIVNVLWAVPGMVSGSVIIAKYISPKLAKSVIAGLWCISFVIACLPIVFPQS